MPKTTCHIHIDNEPFQFEVEGSFFWGENEQLCKMENNVISKTPWKNRGYGVVEAFSDVEFAALKKSVTVNICLLYTSPSPRD